MYLEVAGAFATTDGEETKSPSLYALLQPHLAHFLSGALDTDWPKKPSHAKVRSTHSRVPLDVG